jgi:hypothetical protein
MSRPAIFASTGGAEITSSTRTTAVFVSSLAPGIAESFARRTVPRKMKPTCADSTTAVFLAIDLFGMFASFFEENDKAE